MNSNIRVVTEGFRAVNSADLLINGITLVAGENGCGKSTLSKLLYFSYKTVSNYNILVKKKLYLELIDVITLFEITNQSLGGFINDRQLINEFRKEISDLKRSFFESPSIDEEWLKITGIIEKFEYVLKGLDPREEKKDIFRVRLFRIKNILKSILKNIDESQDLRTNFGEIRKYIDSKFKEANGKINSRPTSLFKEELKSVFIDGRLPKRLEISEFNDLIFSIDKQNISIPFGIQSVIYIDSPMMVNVENDHNPHWEDLNDLLYDENKFTHEISSIITREILHGDVEFDNNFLTSEQFKFKREDGAIFDLEDVATGVKSFAIILLLLKNGKLNDKTLLIIDEPESNLHPQWIIEYARVIVLLNKLLGVKFFLASHNPDMVSAIRYISQKEGVLGQVDFYLARQIGSKFVYNYDYLRHNIEPIFESFNIAIDRVNKYGV